MISDYPFECCISRHWSTCSSASTAATTLLAMERNNAIQLVIIFEMEYKVQTVSAEQDHTSIRYKLLQLFRVNLYYESPTLSLLETVLETFNYLQLHKFAVDYLSLYLFQSQTPVFLYLDPAYYASMLPNQSQSALLVACVAMMQVYLVAQVVAFALGVKYSAMMGLVRKGAFLVVRHLLLLPFLSILLGMYGCTAKAAFRRCLGPIGIGIQVCYIASFMCLALFMGAQTFFNFLFLPHQKQYTRLKKSNHTSLLLFLYMMLCEIAVFVLNDIAQLSVLNLATLFLLGFLWWREEQLQQKAKLIQFSGLASLMLGFLVADFSAVSGSRVQVWVYLLLCAGVWGGTLQLRTYSMKFELDNINKWPTADIMMRQASTIRYYLSRGEEHMFKIYIHGYMEVHRQKCDSPDCPSRLTLSQYDRHLLQRLGYDHNTEQLLRFNNILKVIYEAGYRLSPIPPKIQIENCTYQFMRGEYELSLRNLLQIKHQELSYDGYYVYVQLKEILSQKILSLPQSEFLDLVTQLNLKAREEELFKLFEKAALINLQFWSLLNDDHPDFQKLNEVGVERMRVDAKVRREFEAISECANSQKIVGLFSSYLQCIDNDEQMIMDIKKTVGERYKLKNKLVVHDWSNSSSATLLFSLEENSFGRIIDLNTSAASLFGYQTQELINQNALILWPHELTHSLKSLLLSDTNDQNFYLCHKSGYLVAITKTARNFNSMLNGLTALLSIKPLLQPLSCHCIIDKNNKIVASSASCVSLLSLDFKSYQGEALASIFFHFSYSTVETFKQVYQKDQILKGQSAAQPGKAKEKYVVNQQERFGFKFVEIRRLKHQRSIKTQPKVQPAVDFQFQVEVNTSKLKYVGGAKNVESIVTQFGLMEYESEGTQGRKKVNYGEGISTLRLIDNVVQLIDEAESVDSQQFIHRGQMGENLMEVIPRLDEQDIFRSKTAYQQFLKGFNIGSNLFWLMRVTVALVIALYAGTYVLYHASYQLSIKYSQQIVYQNLIIGAIAKQSAIIAELQLMAADGSSESPSRLLAIYSDNLNYLQQIQLLGSALFSLNYSINSAQQTSLTSQYVSTFINYASTLYSNLEGAKTRQQVSKALNLTDLYTIAFLLSGSTVKDSLLDAFNSRKQQIVADFGSRATTAVAVVSVGALCILAMGLVILYWVRKLNLQKVKVLQIFLQISDPQIQYFSSMSERFLLSTHSDETAELEEDIENARNMSSSTFAKKKSFKLIAFNKSVYFKVAIVPLLMTAFFFHTYTITNSHIAFQINAVDYFAYTAQADYYLSTAAIKLSQAQKTNTLLNLLQLAQAIRLYYRSYFDKDETSFGLYYNFHATFDAIMYADTCKGSRTPYGWVSVNQSCSLPVLAPSGTFLILSSTLTQIQTWNQSDPIGFDLHIKMQTLSKSQRLLSEKLLMAQQQMSEAVSQSVLQALLVWSGVVLVASVVLWEVGGKSFVREVNEVKSTLGMLPLSLAKETVLASRYVSRILQERKGC